MKIPVEWLKEYINTDKSSKQLAESFTLLGLLLDKPIQKYSNQGYDTDVLDLEHRMDRSDWLSLYGCARDVAAFENTDLNVLELHTDKGLIPTKEQNIEIKVECPDIVHRFNTRTFRNITVKESPAWLKNRLEAYGIPSINNIVDITNYVMVELGQPMHAQDIDKMEKPEIVIRKGRVGESLTTLLGETIKLDENCFVLTQKGTPTVLGGVVGGKATGVDFNTKNIVLDAGNYDQTVVRKVSRRLKIQNETVLRYDKFLHPALTEIAIQRATHLILELAGGDYYENEDWYPKEATQKRFEVTYNRIKKVGGTDFTEKQIFNILSKLGYKILENTESGFKVEIPYFRTDIEVEDDIVADILRINGYDKIISVSLTGAIPNDITPKLYTFEHKLKDILARLNLFEYITDPFVTYDEKNTNQIKLENSLTSVKNALRTDLNTTLNPIIETYRKHNVTEVGIFEIGNAYTIINNDTSIYENLIERRVLEVIYSNSNIDIVTNAKKTKSILSALMQNLGISNFTGREKEGSTKIYVNDTEIGTIKWNSFTLDVEMLMKVENPVRRIISDVQHYSHDDLSLSMNLEFKFGDVYGFITKFATNIKSVEVLEEYVDDNALGQNTKAVHIRISYTGTLAKEQLLKELNTRFNIQIRQ